MVEILNGKRHATVMPDSDSVKTAKYFKKTFTKDEGGDFDGVALGIEGDSVSLLLALLFLASV